MATWDFAIAAMSNDGKKRMKEGDVVAYKPHPWAWGKKEIKQFVIVTIDGLTEEEARAKCEPAYGKVISAADAPGPPQREILLKHAHQIPLAALKTLHPEIDLKKIRDTKVSYQPLSGKVFNKTVIMEKK